jgi:SPX domain protein involved in polyphosphate accumulation
MIDPKKYRYEIKITYPQNSYQKVLLAVKSHPALFKEIFYERTINNIYLDNYKLDNYYDNINGVKNRIKHRIRWYGVSTKTKEIFLEYKYKNDKLGWKEKHKIPNFIFDNNFNWSKYLLKIKKKSFYQDIKNEIPTLNNSYLRRYFISSNKQFRVTIDRQLDYQFIDKTYFKNKKVKDPRIILEIKFYQKNFDKSKKIIQNFTNQITANSKYVTGINAVQFNKLIPWEVF